MGLGFGVQITVLVIITYTRLQVSLRNLGVRVRVSYRRFQILQKKLGLVLGLRLGLSIQDFKFHKKWG